MRTAVFAALIQGKNAAQRRYVFFSYSSYETVRYPIFVLLVRSNKRHYLAFDYYLHFDTDILSAISSILHKTNLVCLCKCPKLHNSSKIAYRCCAQTFHEHLWWHFCSLQGAPIDFSLINNLVFEMYCFPAFFIRFAMILDHKSSCPFLFLTSFLFPFSSAESSRSLVALDKDGNIELHRTEFSICVGMKSLS